MPGAGLIVDLAHQLPLVFNVSFGHNVISPHGSFVFGRRAATFNATGLNNAGSTRLFTNGALSVICRPALQGGEANAVKSPASIAAVGTNCRVSARVLTESRALVPAEEEQLVLDYRSADRSAELVALQRAALRRKITPRIEQIIAYKFE